MSDAQALPVVVVGGGVIGVATARQLARAGCGGDRSPLLAAFSASRFSPPR